MTTDRLIVTAAGAALSVWVLWYFLVPPRPKPAQRTPVPEDSRDMDAAA